MCCYIYATFNKISGRWYIGQHFSKWRDVKYIGSGHKLKDAIKKYGRENFSNAIICWCNSAKELNEKERFWIKLYRDNGFDLYNILDGGQDRGKYGIKLSDEQKKHLREINLGNGWRIKGHKVSQETRNRISVSLKTYFANNPLSNEMKEKMKKHIKKTKIIVSKNGKSKIYNSVMEFANAINVKPTAVFRVLNKQRAHVHGFDAKRLGE